MQGRQKKSTTNLRRCGACILDLTALACTIFIFRFVFNQKEVASYLTSDFWVSRERGHAVSVPCTPTPARLLAKKLTLAELLPPAV